MWLLKTSKWCVILTGLFMLAFIAALMVTVPYR
jgi:hypothetical protein